MQSHMIRTAATRGRSEVGSCQNSVLCNMCSGKVCSTQQTVNDALNIATKVSWLILGVHYYPVNCTATQTMYLSQNFLLKRGLPHQSSDLYITNHVRSSDKHDEVGDYFLHRKMNR